MFNSRTSKAVILLGVSALFLFCGADVFAVSQQSGTGIAKVASTVKSNFGAIAQLITAGSYIAGLGFGVGAVVKFKAHKDNPQQVQLSVPIALLFVAAALMFIPSVFKSAGQTLYGTSGSAPGVSGITSITVT